MNVKKLCLLILLAFAFLLTACDPGQPASESSSSVTAEPSADSSAESEPPVVSSEIFSKLSVGRDAFPAPRDILSEKPVDLNGSEPLSEFCRSYTGELPAIAEVRLTEDACCVCIVYLCEKQDAQTALALYDWITLDPTTGSFGDWMDEVPAAYRYDRNSYNQNGYFWMDYTETASVACPYVLLYHENGEDRPLLYEEDSRVYAQIIRQTDAHAVLSLLEDGERSYLLIDKQGNIVSKMDWVSDISLIAPLMFGEGVLYCKMDSDEDYVYDTVGKIDPETGEYSSLQSFGNCEYWTYYADGSAIVIYGGEDTSCFRYYDTASGRTTEISVGADAIRQAEPIPGYLYGCTEGNVLFAWDTSEQSLFLTDPVEADSHTVYGIGMFAAYRADGMELFVRKAD